tara:strand:- start:2366 stop:2698 length:333 start_codon:yes stop_codon:yes gene_type:complete
MKNYLNGLLCLFLIFSCKNEITLNDGELIDLTQTFKNKNKINLSEVAINIEYIPLQTDTANLISDIRTPHKNVELFKNNILINDLGQLYLFNKKGSFLNKIGWICKNMRD